MEEETEVEEELEEWELTGRRSMSIEDMARAIGATPAHKRTQVSTTTELAKERCKSAPQCRTEGEDDKFFMPPPPPPPAVILTNSRLPGNDHEYCTNCNQLVHMKSCVHFTSKQTPGNADSLATLSSPVADLPKKILNSRTLSLPQKIHLPHKVLATCTWFRKAKEEISAPHPHLTTFKDSHMTNPVYWSKVVATKPRPAMSPTEIAEIPLNPPTRQIPSEPSNYCNWHWIRKLNQTSALVNGCLITKFVKNMQNWSEEMENGLPYSRDYFQEKRLREQR